MAPGFDHTFGNWPFAGSMDPPAIRTGELARPTPRIDPLRQSDHDAEAYRECFEQAAEEAGHFSPPPHKKDVTRLC